MMNDENIVIRALEPEDLEYLYQWENDMDLWEVSDTLTPFSHFTLKKYIENSHQDIYEAKQLRLMITDEANHNPIGLIDLYDFDPYHLRAGLGIMIHDIENRKKRLRQQCRQTDDRLLLRDLRAKPGLQQRAQLQHRQPATVQIARLFTDRIPETMAAKRFGMGRRHLFPASCLRMEPIKKRSVCCVFFYSWI